MATLEPACPNCGEMMLDGRSHLNCQSRRERIASLETTILDQADQIGGLTSELEQLRADYGRAASDHEVELGEAREVAELAADANSRLRKQLAESQEELETMRLNKEFWYGEFESTRQQLAASQAETATLRDVFKQMPTWMLERNFIAVPRDRWNRWLTDVSNALATPSAAAERARLLEEVAKAARSVFNFASDRLEIDVYASHTVNFLATALAALDAATGEETLTVEEVKGDG